MGTTGLIRAGTAPAPPILRGCCGLCTWVLITRMRGANNEKKVTVTTMLSWDSLWSPIATEREAATRRAARTTVRATPSECSSGRRSSPPRPSSYTHSPHNQDRSLHRCTACSQHTVRGSTCRTQFDFHTAAPRHSCCCYHFWPGLQPDRIKRRRSCVVEEMVVRSRHLERRSAAAAARAVATEWIRMCTKYREFRLQSYMRRSRSRGSIRSCSRWRTSADRCCTDSARVVVQQSSEPAGRQGSSSHSSVPG
jgi:hypothetical protein